MKHPIDFDEWLGYLDGKLDAATGARVRTHIDSCSGCRETWEELLEATAALRGAAGEFQLTHAKRPETVSNGRARVLERIRAMESPEAVECVAGGDLTVGRLRRLQHLVAPACGAHTAFRLIVAAVGRTPRPQGPGGWLDFLEQLRGLTSALCGRSMARVVWEIGVSLP